MSVISYARQLILHLVKALKLSHKACKIAAKINSFIQTSNASDALKTQVNTWLTATNAVCAAIEAYYDSLPGD